MADPDISIHAPREGCDPALSDRNDMYVIFQSTHPVRGATRILWQCLILPIDFNPRTP